MQILCCSPREAMKRYEDENSDKLYAISQEKKLADFVRLCEDNQVFRTFMPNENFKLNFTNWKISKKCLFSIYVDFGVILVDSRTNSVSIEFFHHGRDYQ